MVFMLCGRAGDGVDCWESCGFTKSADMGLRGPKKNIRFLIDKLIMNQPICIQAYVQNVTSTQPGAGAANGYKC